MEESLERALGGDSQAGAIFFKAFLAGPLFVPERFQSAQLTHSPKYPNEFFGLLGVQGSDQVFIPAFSRPEYIEEWCGSKLSYQEMTGAALVERVPQDWWISINPGLDVEKELSPWEIEQLKYGEEAIDQIVQENFSSSESKLVRIEPIDQKDAPHVFREIDSIKADSRVVKISVLKEVSEDLSGTTATTVLIGIELDINKRETEESQIYFQRALGRAQIGADRVRVFSGLAGDPVLGIFLSAKPYFERSFVQKLRSRFAKLLK